MQEDVRFKMSFTAVVNTEVFNTEVVNTEVFNTEVVNTEVFDTEVVNTEVTFACLCKLGPTQPSR